MSIKRFVLRLCAAALLAVGAMAVLPAERASAQDFSIEIGPDGVQIGRSCPRTYDPVCAGPRSNPRTFRNACQAQRAGARVRYEGECRGRGGDDDDIGGGGRACPELYAPVCGQRRGGRTQTYPNSCEAANSGARVLYRGQCRRGADSFDDADRDPVGRACPRIYSPVCAGPRGRERTFSNSCMAEQAGARVRYAGECQGRQPAWPPRPGAAGPDSGDDDLVIEERLPRR